MIKDTKIAENEKCIFYKNIMTKNYKDGYKIVLVEHKDTNYKEYLLLKNNKPVYASQRIEDVWNHHDTLILIETKK